MPSGGEFTVYGTNCQGNTTKRVITPVWSTFTNAPPYTKRSKPRGIELFFNPTAIARERMKWLDAACYATYVCSSGSLSRTQTTASSIKETYGLTWYSPPQEDRSSVLRSRLLGKIKNQKVNLSLVIAEFPKTAELFINAGSLLLDIIRSAKRGRPPPWLSTHGAANGWLAHRFGVLPLISDINGALEILDGALDRPMIFKVSTTLKGVGRNDRVIPHWNPLGPPGRSINHWTTDYRASAHVQVENPGFQKAASLGLINVPALAWELVPFSFVVDYFINVGDWLGNLDALAGVQRYAATWGESTKCHTEVSGGGGTGTADYLRTLRYILPLQSGFLPNFGKGLNSIRCLSMAALIRQRWHS